MKDRLVNRIFQGANETYTAIVVTNEKKIQPVSLTCVERYHRDYPSGHLSSGYIHGIQSGGSFLKSFVKTKTYRSSYEKNWSKRGTLTVCYYESGPKYAQVVHFGAGSRDLKGNSLGQVMEAEQMLEDIKLKIALNANLRVLRFAPYYFKNPPTFKFYPADKSNWRPNR